MGRSQIIAFLSIFISHLISWSKRNLMLDTFAKLKQIYHDFYVVPHVFQIDIKVELEIK